MNPRSELFGLILIENSVWINASSDSCGLLPRIKSDYVGSIFYRFSSNEIQNVLRIGSDTDIGINRNSSDWLGMISYPILSPGQLFCTTNFSIELNELQSYP